MKRESFTCDVCGAEKKETNHWMVMVPSLPTNEFQRLRSVRSNAMDEVDSLVNRVSNRLFPVFTLMGWDSALHGFEGAVHLCSESCASRALSRWMGDQQKGANQESFVAE